MGVPVEDPPPLSTEERCGRANESLAFFWAMAPIAVKYVGRGASDRAIRQINFMVEAFMALWRLVERPDGPDPYARGANRAIEPNLSIRLPQLDGSIDPPRILDAIRALCREMEVLHPALAALSIPIPSEMPAETAALAAIAEAAIRVGDRAVKGPY